MKLQRVGSAARQLVRGPRLRKEEFFAELGAILLRGTEMSLLLRRVALFLQRSFQSEQVVIAVCEKDRCRMFATPKAHKPPAADVQMLSGEICPRRHGNKVVPVTLLRDTTLRQSLQMAGVKVLLTLALQGECVGYVFVGGKRGGYTERDRRLLEAASGELVIAITNAQALEEVRTLNETLQQKIDEATRELRASNRQLQRLDEAKNEFISMASHQLRTPLTSIKGYLDMMLEGDLGPVNATQRAVLAEAFSSSERMVQLISDFLNVSRLQTGKFMIDRRPTNLEAVIRETVALLQVVANQRDLKIKVHYDRDVPTLLLDTEKFRQVVLNMIDNAVYYSRPQTTIVVRLTREEDEVVFTVQDAGIGVPRDEQADLFRKFFRATNARKKRPDGTGVGLFLARKVVVAHSGAIIFHSEEGKGSVFGFRLPALRLKQTQYTGDNQSQ